MAHIKIVDRFEQDCFFVVEVEHFHDDGVFWFMEHYRWCGNEGLKHKRTTRNGNRHEILMDNGEVAPTTTTALGRIEPYLPDGRDWQRNIEPHMDDSSIWEVIINDHEKRKLAGYAGGRNVLTRAILPQAVADTWLLGTDVLLEHFKDIVGDTVVIE